MWLQSQSAAARQPLVLHGPCHAAPSCMCAPLSHTATSTPALDKKESTSRMLARRVRWSAGATAGEGAARPRRANGLTSLGALPLAPLAWRPGAQMVSA